jgi:predicted phosphodiesterase
LWRKFALLQDAEAEQEESDRAAAAAEAATSMLKLKLKEGAASEPARAQKPPPALPSPPAAPPAPAKAKAAKAAKASSKSKGLSKTTPPPPTPPPPPSTVATPTAASPQATHQPNAPQAARDQLKLSNAEGTAPSVRFFFFSDAHSNQPILNKFLDAATQEHPDLVIDGGDFLHDGTAPEFKRALDQRAALPMPVHRVTGNHDAELRGPYPPEGAPHTPDFQSFDHKGVHFILIDNHDETLTEEQFRKLEADLAQNQGKPTVVSMHVPPLFTKERAAVKLLKNLPLHFASPKMTDEAQICTMLNDVY